MQATLAKFCSDAGFSLVEVMVAMMIFAFVSAAGVAILISFNSGEQAMARADDFIADVQMAKSLMRTDLEQVVLRPVRDPLGGTLPTFSGGQAAGIKEGEQPLLAFVRGGHLAAQVSDAAPAIQRVEYVLKSGTLVRRSFARPDITVETPVSEQILLTGLSAARVRFRNQDNWVLDWVGQTLGAGSLPDLVELEVDINGRGTLRQLFAVGVSS